VGRDLSHGHQAKLHLGLSPHQVEKDDARHRAEVYCVQRFIYELRFSLTLYLQILPKNDFMVRAGKLRVYIAPQSDLNGKSFTLAERNFEVMSDRVSFPGLSC